MSAWAVPALVGVCACAVASNLLMTHAQGSPWALALLLGPLGLALAHLAWRTRRPATIIAAGIGLAGLAALAAFAARGGVTVDALYVLQHAGVHAVLGVSFAASLRGRRSLIGRVAERVHPLTPDMVRYTRHVTQAWVVYFFGMASLSVLVWWICPWPVWSAFASFGTPAVIAAMLLGEYGLRYRVHPEFERVSFRDSLRAWRGRPVAREGPR
jgi:uncharacterized membrane protein